MNVLDFRGRQAPAGPPPVTGSNGKPKYPGKIVGGKLVERDPKTITGITLHQTATLLPPGAADLKAANGDPVLARHLRALRVHAHVTAFTTGTAVVAYPLRAYVWHGNNLNAQDIGLECEAQLEGMAPTCDEKLIAAACDAISWLCLQGPKEGIHLKYIHAHRQSSATRRGDPGLALWQHVALEHAVKNCGLITEPGKVWEDGSPVPIDWQPNGGVGKY